MHSYNIHLEFEDKYGHAVWNLLYEVVTEEIKDIMERKKKLLT